MPLGHPRTIVVSRVLRRCPSGSACAVEGGLNDLPFASSVVGKTGYSACTSGCTTRLNASCFNLYEYAPQKSTVESLQPAKVHPARGDRIVRIMVRHEAIRGFWLARELPFCVIECACDRRTIASTPVEPKGEGMHSLESLGGLVRVSVSRRHGKGYTCGSRVLRLSHKITAACREIDGYLGKVQVLGSPFVVVTVINNMTISSNNIPYTVSFLSIFAISPSLWAPSSLSREPDYYTDSRSMRIYRLRQGRVWKACTVIAVVAYIAACFLGKPPFSADWSGMPAPTALQGPVGQMWGLCLECGCVLFFAFDIYLLYRCAHDVEFRIESDPYGRGAGKTSEEKHSEGMDMDMEINTVQHMSFRFL